MYIYIVFRFVLFTLFIFLLSLRRFGRNRKINPDNKCLILYIYIYIYIYITIMTLTINLFHHYFCFHLVLSGRNLDKKCVQLLDPALLKNVICGKIFQKRCA